MMMRLSEAAVATRGRVLGVDAAFDAVVTDSRAIKGGELFVALRGEHFDGHDFVADCLQHGAKAAMVAHDWQGKKQEDWPLLEVADTRVALGDLAAYWRAKLATPLAAVTGSNGKTTVKEMLASILRAAAGSDAAVLATEGNLNNDIGLPLTLLRLQPAQRYGVVEMGMNHPGEIAYLTRIGKPDVALINNAQPAHLEGMGSVEAVARAKAEIFEGLADAGTAVINADDAYAPLWRELAAPHRVLTFGVEQAADVSADYRLRPDGSAMTLNTPEGGAQMELHVPGLHNVRNALAATAAALAMNISLADIVCGLSGFAGVKGRLQHKRGKHGAALIDDTYNANPASVRAAIAVLAACGGKRVLVLGDMGELGEAAQELHAGIGTAARQAGIETLYAMGEMSRATVEGFGAGARHFESAQALAAAVESELDALTTVLIKGSRFMRMERVVSLLTEQETGKGAGHAA